MSGDMDTARRLLIEALGQPQDLNGGVNYVPGDGPAELLTLRAVRVLAAADVLVCDTGVEADVLALARRDAERLEGKSVDELTTLAREGLQVARLTVGSAWRVEHAALGANGVITEVLPVGT